jgi:hypothetical protein
MRSSPTIHFLKSVGFVSPLSAGRATDTGLEALFALHLFPIVSLCEPASKACEAAQTYDTTDKWVLTWLSQFLHPRAQTTPDNWN